MQETIIHQSSWALTAQGTPIELYKKAHSSKADKMSSASEKPPALPILFVGGIHGDEPEGVRLAQDFLAWIQSLSSAEQSRLREWILIPCLNPDGFRRNERVNAAGVDLNRNFPSHDWSTEVKAPRYFPGPKAGSEKEVQALVQLIEDGKPQLIVHFHSWEPCVVYTGKPGKAAAEILGEDTGYVVREDIGYPTPGSLGQYGWFEKKIPVICIEAQEKSDLASVWSRFAPGLKKVLQD